MTVYRVIARVPFRGHRPGGIFEATLGAAAERRAVERGDIEVVQRSTPGLKPGSWTLPRKQEAH